MLMLLEQNGNELRAPYSKALEDGIFELRVQQGTDITRILYFFMVGHKIIITNGFVKKTQKTPQREIELAKKYRAEYMERIKNMSDFREYLNEQLSNPEFRKEWNDLEPEFNTIQAMIDARKRCKMTQKELAERTGIDQSDISKIETGNANPALSTLKRLAEGMDMILKLEFVPKGVK